MIFLLKVSKLTVQSLEESDCWAQEKDLEATWNLDVQYLELP